MICGSNCKMESKLTMAERLAMWKVAKDASRTKETNNQAFAIATASTGPVLQVKSLASPSATSTSSFLVRQQILNSVDEYCANNENQNMENIMKKKDIIANKSTEKKERKSLLVRGNSLNEISETENETFSHKSSILQKVAITLSSEREIDSKSTSFDLLPSSESYNLSSSPIREWFNQRRQQLQQNRDTTSVPSSPSTCTPTCVLNNTVDDADGYVTATENTEGSICDFDDSRSSFGSDRFGLSSPNWRNRFINVEQRSKPSISTNPLPSTRASTGSMQVFGVVNSTKSSLANSDSISLDIHLRVIENANMEIKILKEKFDSVERKCQVSEDLLKNTKASEAELHNKASMALEEIEALTFLNAIQEQKIIELDQSISKDRMEQNEAISSKARKHKAEIKKMNQDKIEYEERANQMMQQMSEQMAMLQTMAMSRIEDLEKDLLDERRKVESLENEVKSFKIKSFSTTRITRQQVIQELGNNDNSEDEDDDENDGNVTETSDTSISDDVEYVEE